MSQRNLQITVHKQTLEWASESELNAANSCRYIQKNDCCLKKSILWNFIILLLRTSIAIKFFIFDIKWKWSCSVMSDVRLFVTAWTVAYQDPPSMGFSRQEYWSGLPFLSPGDLPDPGIQPSSPKWQADSLPTELPSWIGKLNIVKMFSPTWSIDLVQSYSESQQVILTNWF